MKPRSDRASKGRSWHAVRSCVSKRRYRDQAEAAVHAQYRVSRGSPPLKAYECGHCKGWHLTKRIERTVN